MAKLVYLDDDRIQHLLMKKLTKIHLPDSTVEFFSEPEVLCSWLEKNDLDLILSDLNFEHSSGWDWVVDFGLKTTAPIVFVTASASVEDQRKLGRFPSVKRIIEKPVSAENWSELKELISGLK